MENLEMNKSFWCGKKVFITGHTGFKGSWLATWLKLMGASVTGYALAPPSSPNLFEAAHVARDMNSIEGNILDPQHLKEALKNSQAEIVLHLAAQPLVRYSYDNPVETYAVNVMGTVHLLEAVRATDSVKAVVVVTSDKCYENQEWVWGYRENDPMGGFDPYSSSKGCTELVVSAYRRSYFNPEKFNEHHVALASVRAGNVIGGGDWGEARLVPDLIRSFAKKETALIRHPNAYRPWQHVLDLLQGYLMLAEKLYEENLSFAEAWNFGPSEDNVRPVSWIADTLVELWGADAAWQHEAAAPLHEAKILKLDSNKSRDLLKWAPKLGIKESLEATVDWYRAHVNQEEMEIFTQSQIQRYENQGL